MMGDSVSKDKSPAGQGLQEFSDAATGPCSM